MRTVIASLVGGVLVIGIVACQSGSSAPSPSSSSGSSSGRATSTSPNEAPPDCLQRCEAAAAKCGGADEAFCADACKSYTETQLLCMEAAGCDSAAIAACTSSGDDDRDDDDDTDDDDDGTSSSSSGGGTTTVSCTSSPVEKPSGAKCAASCITIDVNGTEFCAKSCADDNDCSSTTLCTVKGSSFCARTCSSHTTCKANGFTTCATGYAADPAEAVCAY